MGLSPKRAILRDNAYYNLFFINKGRLHFMWDFIKCFNIFVLIKMYI